MRRPELREWDPPDYRQHVQSQKLTVSLRCSWGSTHLSVVVEPALNKPAGRHATGFQIKAGIELVQKPGANRLGILALAPDGGEPLPASACHGVVPGIDADLPRILPSIANVSAHDAPLR